VYRDAQNREEGYADYKVGKVYFAVDEISIKKQENFFPLRKETLAELMFQDKDILSEAEKRRMRSLVFYNCESKEKLQETLTQRKVLSEEMKKKVEIENVGRRVENRRQPIRVVFASCKEANAIYEERRSWKGTNTFISRDLTPEEQNRRDAENRERVEKNCKRNEQQQHQHYQPHTQRENNPQRTQRNNLQHQQQQQRHFQPQTQREDNPQHISQRRPIFCPQQYFQQFQQPSHYSQQPAHHPLQPPSLPRPPPRRPTPPTQQPPPIRLGFGPPRNY